MLLLLQTQILRADHGQTLEGLVLLLRLHGAAFGTQSVHGALNISAAGFVGFKASAAHFLAHAGIIQDRAPRLIQGGQFLTGARLTLFVLGQCVVALFILPGGLIQQQFFLLGEVSAFLADNSQPCQRLIVQVHIGAGLVQQIDGLVR